MIFDWEGLNYWAILVATIAGFMLGGIWYVFSKQWLAAIGKKPEELGNPASAFGITFLSALVTAMLIALLVNTLPTIKTVLDGMILGLWIGIAAIAASMASDYAFRRWPQNLFFIQAGYPSFTA
jgi:dipeptide/tripeptide permease